MARRKKKSHGNPERWLVSYADLLTLLFAFFVVMFASTQSDKSRAQKISEAVDRALETSTIAPQISAILGGTRDDKGRGNDRMKGPAVDVPAKLVDPPKPIAHPPSQNDLANAIKTLQTTLGAEMKQGQVQVHLEQRGAVISLNAQAVFPSGGDSIDNSILPLLAKVAVTLNELPNPVRLEGHTDSLPISNQRFHSNWELSAARSIAMLRILNERYGIGRERMAIVGYADTYAIGDNQTEAGRMKNRRVDLVLLSDFGSQAEPPKPGAAKPCVPPCNTTAAEKKQ
jgi:chemotaxis protein MotB